MEEKRPKLSAPGGQRQQHHLSIRMGVLFNKMVTPHPRQRKQAWREVASEPMALGLACSAALALGQELSEQRLSLTYRVQVLINNSVRSQSLLSVGYGHASSSIFSGHPSTWAVARVGNISPFYSEDMGWGPD